MSGNEYRYEELLLGKLDKIIQLLNSINKQEKIMSQELLDLEAEVTETKDVEESAVVLLQGLTAQLTALAAQLAQEGIDNTKVIELRDNLKASTDSLAAAVVANTPA